MAFTRPDGRMGDDVPIDPALLEEEVGDEEDAEGELVDEFEVEGDLQPYEVSLSGRW
jgi:hypothetical protein